MRNPNNLKFGIKMNTEEDGTIGEETPPCPMGQGGVPWDRVHCPMGQGKGQIC